MSKRHVWGIYASYISEFIKLKRSLGFKYNTEEYIFHRFDQFTIDRGETEVGITKELADKWCERRNNESDSFRCHRCVCLSQLSSYLCRLGIRSFIPRIPRNQSTFTPYIFSKDQIDVIFSSADLLRAQRKIMRSMIFVMPALLRLLYGTGLRISEAVALRNKDVNLTENYLIIKDSKNGKQRMVPISESLSIVCKEYVEYRDLLPISKSKEDTFFISLNGSKLTTDAVYRRFQDILKIAGIPFIGNHHGPRLHDIRHTFAVNSLAHMAESGIDLYCSLPILSTYLGHQSLSATDTYVRLTSMMYPGLLKNIDLVCLNVFPNLSSHETN
jgi:integrase/recombinase XerD